MDVVLCAYHWAGCRAVSLLRPLTTRLFVCTHDAPPYIPSVIRLCNTWNIPCTTCNVSQVDLPFRPDVLISVYYRYRITETLLNSRSIAPVNLHPSLLPRYRGCSSTAWALINGDAETGFTYHVMDGMFDSGPIILQRRLPIYPWDTGLSLYYRVMFEGLAYLTQAIDACQDGIAPRAQVGPSSYHPRGCPYGGEIDDAWPDDMVERFIRAMIFPPLPPAQYKGMPVLCMEDYLALRNNARKS